MVCFFFFFLHNTESNIFEMLVIALSTRRTWQPQLGGAAYMGHFKKKCVGNSSSGMGQLHGLL